MSNIRLLETFPHSVESLTLLQNLGGEVREDEYARSVVHQRRRQPCKTQNLLLIRIVMQSGHHGPRTRMCISNRARAMGTVNLQRFWEITGAKDFHEKVGYKLSWAALLNLFR